MNVFQSHSDGDSQIQAVQTSFSYIDNNANVHNRCTGTRHVNVFTSIISCFPYAYRRVSLQISRSDRRQFTLYVIPYLYTDGRPYEYVMSVLKIAIWYVLRVLSTRRGDFRSDIYRADTARYLFVYIFVWCTVREIAVLSYIVDSG